MNRNLPRLERELPLGIPAPIHLDPAAPNAWLLLSETTWQRLRALVPELPAWPRTDVAN